MKTVIFNSCETSDSDVESLNISFQRTKILWLTRAERVLRFTRKTSFTLSRETCYYYAKMLTIMQDIIDKLRFSTCRILSMISLESCGRPRTANLLKYKLRSYKALGR